MIEKMGTLNHHSVQLKCVLLHLVSWYYEWFTDEFWRGEINVCAIIVIYCHCEKATVPNSMSCKHPFPWICLVFLKLTFPIKYSKINTCAILFLLLHHELFLNWFSFQTRDFTLTNWRPNIIPNLYFRVIYGPLNVLNSVVSNLNGLYVIIFMY